MGSPPDQGTAVSGTCHAALLLRCFWGAKPQLCCHPAWALPPGARQGWRERGWRGQPGEAAEAVPAAACCRHLKEKFLVGEEESWLLGELLSFAQPSGKQLWGGVF